MYKYYVFSVYIECVLYFYVEYVLYVNIECILYVLCMCMLPESSILENVHDSHRFLCGFRARA